jgi:hypothetical protein
MIVADQGVRRMAATWVDVDADGKSGQRRDAAQCAALIAPYGPATALYPGTTSHPGRRIRAIGQSSKALQFT